MNLSPLPVQRFYNNLNVPLVGGKLFTYAAGTTTKIATYSDSGGTLNTNPVRMNFRGECNVWLDPTLSYKFVLAPATDTDPPTNPIWTVDNIAPATAIFGPSAAEIAAGVTIVNYQYPWGWVDRYGTNTSPGTTDMTGAFLAAFLIGGKIYGISGSTYKLTGAIYCTVSGTDADFTGCTINQATAGTPFLYVGRTISSSSFVKTDHFRLRGGTYTGSVSGGGTAAYGITIMQPSDNPYVNGNGCNDIEILDITISGFTGGVLATAASNVMIHDCQLGTMVYHSGADAGGYGALMQACFEIDLSHNYAKAGSTSRHAFYISADPTRANTNDNVCKGVILHANRIDWSGTSGATGFEYAIQLRSPERLICTDNEILGGYGGIALECENGDCYNPIISNNIVRNISGNQNCIQSHRTSGTFRIRDAVVCNNSCFIDSATLNGIVWQYTDGVTVEGNTISGGTALSCINFSNCTDVTVGDNTIRMTGAGAADGVSFSNTVDGVVVNKNRFSGTFTKQYRYYANPTNISFGFARKLSVASDGAGNYTIVDDDDIVASATSNANGLDITFENWVTAGALSIPNTGLLTCNSSVGQAYRRALSGQVLTVGVTNFAGAALPAATNAYTIAVQLFS